MAGSPRISIHLLPTLIPPGALNGGIAIVVDILRATTAMIHAIDSGIESIIPCVEVDEALEIAERLGHDQVLLGGERQGVVIEGFALGNSPTSYTPEACRGKTLVITTTNGTRAIHASLDADRVLIAAFVNLEATLQAIEGDSRPVHVVCAGTNDCVSLEDSLFAGALVSRFRKTRKVELLDDETILVVDAWERLPVEHLAIRLSEGRGGQRVRELGLEVDIRAAASVDRFPIVAELFRDPLRILRV